MAGRLVCSRGSSTCDTTLKENGATIPCVGRCYDGASESIVSLCLKESTVLIYIGNMKIIKPVTVEVAPWDAKEAQIFTFSKEWAVPHIVFPSFIWSPALLNMTFLVADTYLAENDLLIGQTVLKRFGIEADAMIENNSA